MIRQRKQLRRLRRKVRMQMMQRYFMRIGLAVKRTAHRCVYGVSRMFKKKTDHHQTVAAPAVSHKPTMTVDEVRETYVKMLEQRRQREQAQQEEQEKKELHQKMQAEILAEDDMGNDRLIADLGQCMQENSEAEQTKKQSEFQEKLVVQQVRDDVETDDQLDFYRRHRDVENVYECIPFHLAIDDSAPLAEGYPFYHHNTDCQLLCDQKTLVFTSDGLLNYAVICRPNKYYRRKTDSWLYPCQCLALLDLETYTMFSHVEDPKELAKLIGQFGGLTRAQQEHIRSMAARPVLPDQEKNGFVPIRDEAALRMMYRVCKDTYAPAVRARAETLLAQLEQVHNSSERCDLVAQLAFTIGIDTAPQRHPQHTYEEYMAILNKHIYGLSSLKESLVEFLVSMQYAQTQYFALLLVGPPGVGKTCICDAMAECLDSPVAHIDCSGVNNVAMSGLVKSYGGAKAGKVMDGLLEQGKADVLMRLDELDKMTVDKDGDPYGALIKPLGPQRTYFDEFVASDLDVSVTKFVATANDITKIPGYILSRFENNIFTIEPYTEDEKVEIAKNHIVPKRLAEHKLNADSFVFTEEALRKIIREYCSDEGVRELEGNIIMLLRKAITEMVRGNVQMPVTVDGEFVKKHLRKTTGVSYGKAIGF